MIGVSWLVLCYLREKNRSIPSVNWGFLGASVVKNLPASAGDSFDPWSWGIPHAAE